jgi:quercetin dioxygenase-like cupin family protein
VGSVRRGPGNLPHVVQTDLVAEAVEAGGEGVVWTLGAGEDLNANLVRFGAGRGVGEHANEEVDVVFVGVSGSGFVELDGEENALDAGKLVFIPRGSRRSTRAGPEGFAYLTVHRRRGPIRIGP